MHHNSIPVAFEESVADKIMESVRGPTGRELSLAFKVKRYMLQEPSSHSQRYEQTTVSYITL